MEKTFEIIHFCLNKVLGINLFEPIEPNQKKKYYTKRFLHIFCNIFISSYCTWDLILNKEKKIIDRALLTCVCPGILVETILFIFFLTNLNCFRDNIQWIRGRYVQRSDEVVERYSKENYGKYAKIMEKTVV